MAGQTRPAVGPSPAADGPAPVAAAPAPWWPREAAEAVRVSLTAVAAIWLAMWLELELPHWAGWTVISVTLSTRAASLQKSLWRAGATVVGVATALALVGAFAQATLAFDVALALWLGLLTAASTIESGQRSYGFALMGFTVPIVALAQVQDPGSAFHTGVDRCSTILLGIGCAYVSNTLVVPGVPAVGRALADRLEAAADACAAWIAAVRGATGGDGDAGDGDTGDGASGDGPPRGRAPGPMPVEAVAALGGQIVDAFTEQPSLRAGGRQIRAAAPLLRRVLAAGLLRALLPDRAGARSTVLLGDAHARGGLDHAGRQIARVRVAARLLREGRRIGRRRVPFRPHLLLWNDRDWDGRHALDNGLRAALAVSLVNAFWYASGWVHGAEAATWAGLLAALLAAHPHPAAEARAFLLGAALAAAVGLVVRYTLLTATGDFPLLAAVLMPVCMLAVVGRSDKRAVYGAGFGFLVLGVIDPTDAMTYDLSDSLNTVLAELVGMGVAVAAFTALPPPVGPGTLRARARRRLVGGVRGAALGPRLLLPPRDRWLARAFGRLEAAGGDTAPGPAGPGAEDRAGRTLLVVGLLLVALREADEGFGRAVGRAAWAGLAAGGGPGARAALDGLARGSHVPEIQAERVAAVAALVAAADLSGWPGLGQRGGA